MSNSCKLNNIIFKKEPKSVIPKPDAVCVRKTG
jgi:hypothetical protein